MATITLDVEDVKALLDVATNSMDFGSGFLDQAEVETMRKVAVAVGVDPLAATPDNFRRQFAHDYKPLTRWVYEQWDFRTPRKELAREQVEVCESCGGFDETPGPDDPIHHGVDNPAASSE